MGADEDTSGKSFSGINLLSTLCQIKPFHQVTIVFSSYFPSRLSRENKKTIVYLASKDLTANKKKENVVGGWSLLGKKCPLFFHLLSLVKMSRWTMFRGAVRFWFCPPSSPKICDSCTTSCERSEWMFC